MPPKVLLVVIIFHMICPFFLKGPNHQSSMKKQKDLGMAQEIWNKREKKGPN